MTEHLRFLGILILACNVAFACGAYWAHYARWDEDE